MRAYPVHFKVLDVTVLTVVALVIPVEGHEVIAAGVNVDKGEDDVGTQKGVDVFWQEFTDTLSVLRKTAVVTEHLFAVICKGQQNMEVSFVWSALWVKLLYHEYTPIIRDSKGSQENRD